MIATPSKRSCPSSTVSINKTSQIALSFWIFLSQEGKNLKNNMSSKSTLEEEMLCPKVNFAAVFAELLPHSELAAAERCGVNLAQDLIKRFAFLDHLKLHISTSLNCTLLNFQRSRTDPQGGKTGIRGSSPSSPRRCIFFRNHCCWNRGCKITATNGQHLVF